MNTMVKSHWVADANHVKLTMPFSKIDTENRLVSGYATLDNLDSQGDIVLAEASKKAFARARGNIREMHQPIAAGHLVDFREDEYYDTETQKFYRGIFVTAYVSKGADSTWEKVLDGTLTGFSIGGEIKEASNEFVKEADTTVRFIKDYDLVELSLVDNPANQLANVFSIQKSFDGSVTMKGMIVEAKVENIFWCETDGVARTLDTDSATCLNCESEMKIIGWVENGESKAEKVQTVVTKYLKSEEKTEQNATSEGGVNMNVFKKNNDEGEVVAGIDEGREAEVNSEEPTVPPAEQDANLGETKATQDEATPQDGEVVAGVDEVTDEDTISKKLDALHLTVTETLEKTRTETTQAVAALEDKVEELNKSFETKISEFENRFSELGTKLDTAKSKLTDFEKSLDSINSSDAIKKSADVEKTAEPKQKQTTWNGAFSVDNLLNR